MGYGSGRDDRPESVTMRWSPTYGGQDFVPDRSEAFSGLASGYDTIGAAAAQAHGLLDGVVPASWTGAAADAFGKYVGDLKAYLEVTITALDDSSSASRRAARSISSAEDRANGAANKANAAQRLHAAMSKARKDNILNWLNPVDAGKDDAAAYELWRAVGDGNGARGDALDADKALAQGLSGPDHALSTAREPSPPNPLDEPDSAQAALLAQIMQPVVAALKADGDTARSRAAASDLEQKLRGKDLSADQVRALIKKYGGALSSAELTYVLDHVDERELGNALSKLDSNQDRDTYNILAGKADAGVLARLADTDPNHYWHPALGSVQYIWQNDGLVAGQVPEGNPNDVRQGALSDCHDLSALAAVEQAHPGYLEDHIRANANGTYTVRLYKDGKPVDVVVTPDVPYQNNADGSPMGSAYTHGDNGPTAYQVYEKALAQSNGEFGVQHGTGYQSLNGGYSSRDWSVITGQQGTSKGPGDTSPTDLRHQLDQGKPVVANTPEYDQAPTPKSPSGQDQAMIGGHAYRVVSVDTGAHPPTVTLANPWDPTDPTNGTVTISWDEFTKDCDSVNVGSTP